MEAYVRGDLLIEHGNRYDPWNIVDHSALRQERSLFSRGLGKRMQQRVSGTFVPPPGSFMVIKVINEIKHRYRFVDLLKPKTEAALPILLALHSNLQHILAAALQMSSGTFGLRKRHYSTWYPMSISTGNGIEPNLFAGTG
jgi:hypothetical protein